VLVFTGDGKGKTTAAMGLAARAAGRGHRVLAIQFIKSPQRSYGEQIALQKLGVEIVQTGAGFTWTKTPEEHREALRQGWALARERILRGKEKLIILDEINNALAIRTGRAPGHHRCCRPCDGNEGGQALLRRRRNGRHGIEL